MRMAGFCPLCAQYMNSILAEVPLDALEEADVDLVIIGNGSDKMLSAYRSRPSLICAVGFADLAQTKPSDVPSKCTPTPHSPCTALSA